MNNLAFLQKLPGPMKNAFRPAEIFFRRKPYFVILSCGRSGSRLTSNMLTDAGILCGHEYFFSTQGFCKRSIYRGDSSWLALPYLETDPSLTKVILHQIRDPLKVIGSLVGIEFFSKKTSNKFKKFAEKHITLTGNEEIDAMRWWIEWNQRAEAISSHRFRVEKIADLVAIPEKLGYSKKYAQKMENSIEKNYERSINSRRKISYSYSDLPESSEKDKIIEMSSKYGYI